MLRKTTSWLAAFLELQLVIFLLSLPIIIHWGLAVSCMLPLANIIFTPLLTCFLWCSCIFTGCNLLQLPNSWIATVLNYITLFWHYLLSYAEPSWLVGFSHATIWLALSIALAVITFYILIKPTRSKALGFLISCTLIIFATKIPKESYTYKKINHLNMAILTIHNKTYLLDNGGLCSKYNFYSWIDYTILPTLIKTAGITTIDTLVLYKPNKKLPQVVEQFTKQTNVQHIFVTKKCDCFNQLKKLYKNSHITIQPIDITSIH